VSPVTAALGSNAGEFFVSQTHLRVSGGTVSIAWEEPVRICSVRCPLCRLGAQHALWGPIMHELHLTHGTELSTYPPDARRPWSDRRKANRAPAADGEGRNRNARPARGTDATLLDMRSKRSPTGPVHEAAASRL
jgi:hypothetical protein